MNNTMKVVAITNERQCELIEKPKPNVKDDFVVIKIQAAPMCTEYKSYKNGTLTDCLGHEAVGEVVEVARPGKVKVGDRVVVMPQYPCGTCSLCLAGEYIHCRNNINVETETGNITGTATYAQYMIKQDWLLLPIPAEMSYEHAGMACCGLGPTFGAMQLMQVDAFDTVLITGMGPVGLGGVINATYRGARVIAVESHPFRQRLAEQLGAEFAIDPNDTDALGKVMEFTDGIGVDKALDCSGVPGAQRFLIDAARRKGQMAFVGVGDGDLIVHDWSDMITKGLTLLGSWHWNLADMPRIMQVIRESGDKIDTQITHTFPMSRVQDAWDLQLTGNCGKIILKPWE